MYTIPFQTTTWADLPITVHQGETGRATWRTKYYGDLRIRIVDYSPGYKSNHWCELGHLLFCIEGEIETELRDGAVFRLTQGMSYEVSDHLSSHRSRTVTGAKLIIIDGGFLRGERKNNQ